MVRSGSTSSVGAKSPSSNNNNGMSADDLEILSVAIMETIRRIRAQKQRPSLERISKWVMAHTAAKDCTFQQVHEQLEAMSASGRVLKVFNQGEYSYRDPETMTPRTCGRTPKHWKEAKQRNSPLTTPKTHKSPLISPTSPKIASPELTLIPRNSLMRHKTLQVTDYIKLVQVSLDGLSQPEGATIKDMDRYLETTYYIEGISAIEFSRHLRLACKRLVNAGRLMRDGLVFRLSINPPITPEAKTTNGATNSEEKSENKPLASPLPLLVCSYCCGTEQCNKDGNAESLLSCVDCGNSGHPSCMKVSPDLAANLRGDLKWQCIECKSCQVCGSKGNADNLLFCDSCDRGIHMECCTPPLTKMPKGTFVCELCKTSDVHKKRDLEHGKLPSRGPGRPPHAQRRLLAPGTTPPRSTGSMKNGAVGEQPQEVLSESGQHFLQVPFDKKPKGLIDGMTKFFTPSMGGRKTMTSQARTTQLMIMKQSGVTASDCTSANEDEENITDKTTDPAKKSCKANITEVDENMFFRAREESLQRTGVVEGKNPDPSAARCPENIEFGKYSIETWYSSPYPQEYARLKRLYLCEFCLKYMKSRAILHRHAKKCQWFHPPANEIYRSNNLSVFEVDGNVSKIYCQNLCLLAKLFLDHKTLYYDVEPFSFYCLTINDSKGCHLIGYFSKEKHCQQKYNVSCIMTMPQYQRQGYGRFLIDFSYLLSRKEGQAGSPEKPLSDLGQVSYNAYWKSALLEFLSTRTQTKLISLRDISKATGICPHDVASALQSLGMIKVLKSKDENSPQQFKFNLSRKRQVLSEYMNKREGMRNDPTRPPRPTLDPDCLRWTPLVASTSFLSDESGLRSPSTTPEKRPPLAPTSRLNLSATNKQESASVESHNSSDIENIQVTLSTEANDSNHDSVEAKENLPTLSEAEKTILNQPITTMDLKPSNQDEPITMQDLSDSNQDRPITNDDISKGFLPPSSVVQRKRGRPRKNPGIGLMEPEGPEEGSSPGSLNSRKKRRRKVKGYPWGKVKKKKKKKKFIDNSSDKLDTSDSEKPTRGNGWRMGGPHFSSESEEENDKDEDLKHPPLEASDTMSSEMSQIDTNSIEDVPEPPESCSPENFAALSQMRKRRRRKSKGYQWGTKKRKIKKTFVSVLRRVTGGAVAKHNNQPKISELVAEKLKEVTTKVDTKKPKQTTMDRFFQPKPTFLVANESSASSSNNNNINITASKSSTEMKSLSNALIDSKHVVVASVTISPTKSPLKQQLTSPETKRKQSALISPGSEPKQRRRSAIASDNFVASCLLSTRTPRRETLEKKRPRGRPRINFPPELETAPNSLEDQSPPQEVDAQRAESSGVKESFLAQSPHIQNEAVSNNKPKAEGTVAFAQPWIANVSSGSSNVAQSSHNSFTLAHEGRFKDMSFKAANTNALGQNKKVKAAINWQSPSLTTYRDMNQINDEDIDISSSSSSEAESSSCSSAESSCDNSSDEEQNELRDVGEDLSSTNQQWRGSEKTKRLMKTSSQSSEKQEDVGATGPVRERLGVKRGRGRPRKYPPKDPSGVSEKIKVKKKSKKVQEVREKIKLTVRRTSVGYHTTHTEDAAAEQTLSSSPNSPHHQEEPKSPEERIPKAEVSVEPERTQLSESCEDSDSNENFADKKADKSALRCHADPTLPTWASDSCATSQDCWGRKSPDANQTPSSANSLAMDDDVAMTTVFPTMSGIRPSSALENNSPSAMDLDGSRDARDEEDTRPTPETSTWKPQQCSTRAEEENEINAAVASITQLDAASPLVTADYSGAAILDEQPSPHPIDPPLIRLDRHDDAQEMLSHDDEAQTASNDVEQNLLNDNDEAQNPPNNENQDKIMLTYDEGCEKLLTRDAEQPMLSQDDTAQSPDESMERTITEEKFLESSALHSSGEFPSNMGEMQGFDPQSELPLGTTSQPLATASQPLATAPQQCNFNEAPYSGEFVSTNSEPLQIQTYQSELAFQCQQQSGGYQDNGNLQQPLYESDTQRMYNASCMGSQPPPPQHDVIDENNQAVMTSPKPSYAQQVSQTTMAAPACHASVVQVHPQGSQHPQVHPAYPPAPGGSGSTSGYETLSNNSCSPYTSPESLNPGSCDHNTITTTASATFTPEQAGIPLGAGPMSVGVQQHLQANFPPSIDSGHGSEYLSSPPSLGVSSTQGTPPKPSVVPQQTLMSPEPSFPQGRQQLNSAGSYNNLSSPNMTQQNTNMTQQSRPSCAVGDPLHPPQNLNLMPCMIQQQRSPSVSKTPTTPQCGFPRAEEGFGGNVEPRHPPVPSPPHTAPSSLMKLQKLTRQISVESPSATHRAPLGKGAFPTPQTHLRRPRYTGVPERPASVQPPVIPSMEKPHPSTPPAGMVDRPRDGYYGNKDPYARVNTLASGEYPYNWEQGVQHFPRHNPSYPTYEQSWPPGAFGTYPGYSTQAPHCQLERQYTSQKFTHPSGGNYPQNTPHNSMLMNPNRQTWGGRDPYEQGSGYEGLVVRPPFPTHEMHPRPPNLHPYYSGPTYPGYTNQGGYNNSFPHR